MHGFLPFIVIGLATGAVYGLGGMGLVLTYKTSGIFNVGYGAVAAADVFVFYFLRVNEGLSWPLTAAICLLVVAPVLGLLLEVLARSLHNATETVKVVATVGLILIVEAIGYLWNPYQAPTFPYILPQSTVRMLGVNVTWANIIIFLFSVVSAAVLYWFFRSVRLGVVMRGVVDNPDLVSMSGDDPVLVRRWAWVIGTVFAAVAGLMLAPALPVDGVTLPTAIFATFGAAAIGYFTSLPWTFVGGLVVGIATAILDKYSARAVWIGGFAPALPFVILFLVLIVTPRARLATRRFSAQRRTRVSYHAPLRVRLVTGAVAVALLAMVPSMQAGKIAMWSNALITMILFLSLGLLVRRSGQISLCQFAFAAVGAAAFGHIASAHVPWLFALILATLVAVPVGALIAIPAIRVSGVFLALATLGFGILMEQALYTRSFLFGDTTLGTNDPRPHISVFGLDLSSDKGFYYLLLLIVVLVVLVYSAIGSGRLGRLLEGMADSELALETNGASSSTLKVIVFCISAAIASLAGALTGMLYQYAVGTYFPSFGSLSLVALVVIITVGDPWFAVMGSIGYAVIPGYISGNTVTYVLTMLFGVGAITAAHGTTRAATMPMRIRAALDRLGGRTTPEALTPLTVEAPPGPRIAVQRAERPEAVRTGSAQPGSAPEGLEVRDLSVHFGGVKAVNGVSLSAPMGRITGLVGPNGAGKTTIFNACSGLNRPTAGRIFLHGAEVTGEGPAARARRGLGRTFQRTELFNSLTVRQNIALGREAPMAGVNPLAMVFASRAGGRLVADATDDALTLTGTRWLADVQVGLLPIGQRRLVELARTLAGPFDVLLLDEPSSGLDGRETHQFGQVLQTVIAERGCGILLVEHDMTLVREVCDYVHVLDFGIQIFEGTPEEMHASGAVRAAYLGDTAAVGAGRDAYEDGLQSIPSME
ncbi:MAG TPA: branched-chain amino acid ABC transporter permease/ATP-binding protein [Acidimicrobiales bacterium]|nr:branched-chain amino acid ABC transporter permease/ATP-binding protein [Acidimicrobiales bacterium]